MMKDSKREKKIIEAAREQAQTAADGWRENYDRARDDYLFIDGEGQWDEKVRQEREQDGRPCLTINRLPAFVDSVVGDARQNKFSIETYPVEPDAINLTAPGMAGTRDYTMSEVMQAIIKEIEYRSRAEQHYIRALEQAAHGGVGWLRVITDYIGNKSFDQELLIKSVRNPFTVHHDPRIEEPDGTDANFSFVHVRMDRKEFDSRYPGADTSPIAEEMGQDYEWFFDKEHARLSEYYWREKIKRELCLYSDGSLYYADEAEAIEQQLSEAGITKVRSRMISTHRVWWAKITANEVLEGPTEIPGTIIPVVLVAGKELMLEGRNIYRSVIRDAKDAQRIFNYWRTAATEAVALAPKAPWLATAEQVAGNEVMWKHANVKNYSTLIYNHRPGLPPPQRMPPPNVPAAEMQQAMAAAEDLKATTGIFDAALGARSNEVSGKAIIARQTESNISTFTFHDNLKRAIRTVGRILVDTIPVVYDTFRVVRLRRPDDTDDFVPINQMVTDEQGNEVKVYDVGVGKYDVRVGAGPSYATQRKQAADSLMTFIQQVPTAAPIIMDLVAKHMDWPGADEMAERMKKMLPEQLKDDDGQPKPPDPAMVAQMKELEAKVKESEAKFAKAQSDIIEAAAKIAETRMAEPDQVKQMVADAIAEFLREQQSAA